MLPEQPNQFPEGFSFRHAVLQDQPAIQALFTSIHTEYGFNVDLEKRDKDLTDLANYYPAETGFFGVLFHTKNKLVGTVALKPLQSNTVELGRLYLDAAYRGQGLGQTLLQIAIEQARQMGAHRIILETHTRMGQAIQRYEKFGFSPMTPLRTIDPLYTDYVAELWL